ncbi:hypothetical protein AMV104 [Betaentomopoxvirus amoorei]|uniref:AMV104 n=1 Tax=Amsacta moorei entomopoxvirus TaxID=28321 RepID=Q9EMU5_AMEPV|nr:hypothetical protein AMV104 [Amsacta moorei entomopoxvirus]AAG02810.1 AMV104 [Amsacta moorei entomopoxvirus]
MSNADYVIIYNCGNDIESYKDIDLSCDVNIPITNDDMIISDEILSYESSIYIITNYDDDECNDQDCDLILISNDQIDKIDLCKLKKFINNKSEIIIVSKNEDFQNNIKEIITDADVTCYTEFKYIIGITNCLLNIKCLKKIYRIKVFNYDNLP